MAMRKGAFDDEEFIRMDERDVLETESFDLVRGPLGEVGDGAFTDAFAFAPVAQEDGGAGPVSIYMATSRKSPGRFRKKINDTSNRDAFPAPAPGSWVWTRHPPR